MDTAMSPIQSLPTELLLKILHTSAQETQEKWIQHLLDNRKPPLLELTHTSSGLSFPSLRKRRPDDPQPAPHLMVKLSQVCRLWRDVSVTHAALWAHVDVRDEAETTAMLKRAGSQPLTVTFRLPNTEELAVEGVEVFKSILEDHITHIDTLVMPLLPEMPFAQLLPRATELRRLLFIEPSPAPTNPNDTQSLLLARSDLHKLKTLKCYTPLWASLGHLCVPTLTTLELYRNTPSTMPHRDDPDPDYTTGLWELVHVLAQMRDLEHLAVEISDAPFGRLDRVVLPKLRSLRVRAATSVCAALLCCVQLPSTTKLRFRCLYGTPGPAVYDTLDLPRVLTDAVAHPEKFPSTFTPVRAVALTIFELGWSLCGWREVRTLKGVDADVPPDVQIAFARGAAKEDLLIILGAMPLGEVSSARVKGLYWQRSGEPAIDCAKMFATAPRLERLALEGVHPCLAWEFLEVTPAMHIYLQNVPFEWDSRLRGDRKRTERGEEYWKRTFEYSDHVSEVRAVLDKREALGLKPWTEIRHGTRWQINAVEPAIDDDLPWELFKADSAP